jgi:DNA-binding MarR family transcriptional regulator
MFWNDIIYWLDRSRAGGVTAHRILLAGKVDMTLEQLRVFVAVAERQHVTEAARTLNLAQSAASHAIAALEARHDTKLFDRVGRRIELTEAGRVFLAEARAVLARAEAAELALSEFGALKRGTLLIQASQTVADYWLPRHLSRFGEPIRKSAYVSASAIPPKSQRRSRVGQRDLVSSKEPWGASIWPARR